MSDDNDPDLDAAFEPETPASADKWNPAHLGHDDEPKITKGRVLSETTRAAFKGVIEANKGKKFDDDDEGDHDDPVDATTSAAAGAPSASQEAAPTAGITPAAAPSPVTSAVDAIAAERMAQLDAKEKALTERETQIRDHRGRFKEDHVTTIKEMIREAHGLGPDDDIKPYAMDLVTEMSGELLGLEVPDSVRTRQERKKVERLMREHNATLSKREADLTAKEKVRAEQEQEQGIVRNIRTELAKPETAAKYPWLMASKKDGDPADIAYGVAKAIIKLDPSWTPSLHDAAERANKFYEKQAKEHYDQYKHLLSPAQPKPQTTTATPQERPPGSRPTRTLTNDHAAEAPTRSTNPGRPLTNDDRRRASLRKFAASIPVDD